MRDYLTLEQLKQFSLRKIERLQNSRFKATARYLLPRVPFYRKLFKEYGIDTHKLSSIEDWHALGLPLVKKATYMKKPRDFVVQPDPKKAFSMHLDFLSCQNEFGSMANLAISAHKQDIIKDYYTPKMVVFSGGTESGKPTPVLLTATQKFDTLMGVLKIIGALLTEQKRKVGMNVFPYAPHLGWHAVHYALDINTDLNLGTAAGGAIPTTRLIDMAAEAQPDVICGMNDYLRNRFLPMAIDKHIRLPKEVFFINGAQKMLEMERQQIKDFAKKLGVKQAHVLDLYGASEFKESLMPECREGSGFHHIAPLSTIIKTVEVHHATKHVIDDWDFSPAGHAVSWNIDGGGTLLEGYFVGDTFERIETSPCQHCKLNVKRIFNINRIRDVQAQLQLTGMVEEKIKGTRINLVALRDTALRIKGVREAQVILKRKKHTVEVRYVASAPKRTKAQLQKAFAGAEIKPKLVPTTLQRLQGEKFKFEPIRVE